MPERTRWSTVKEVAEAEGVAVKTVYRWTRRRRLRTRRTAGGRVRVLVDADTGLPVPPGQAPAAPRSATAARKVR